MNKLWPISDSTRIPGGSFKQVSVSMDGVVFELNRMSQASVLNKFRSSDMSLASAS
eukprot:CAMPEP_0197389034 /NCGR_PEP_ID=MMETSP1165-20131217/1388_1 /TAXON_ID=284809 /ORGANISM="Chrysocystis fragilis, Strain CCMP3189" /LENGTH=55 /DNA_ID=CAMNT_0042914389 /DNA_START=95 /DNA_END=259 /DNA_ORIENTATION=-